MMDMTEEFSAASAAAQRVEFQLSYHRCPEKREFGYDGITGPYIDCAYELGKKAPGGWAGGWLEDDATEGDWLESFVEMAVQEGVHEVLEWLVVDGRRWLDPHGEAETRIHGAVAEFVDVLRKIRAEHAAVAS